MPNSGTSRPSSSTSLLTRSGRIAFTILKTTNVKAKRVHRAERGAAELHQELRGVAVEQTR